MTGCRSVPDHGGGYDEVLLVKEGPSAQVHLVEHIGVGLAPVVHPVVHSRRRPQDPLAVDCEVLCIQIASAVRNRDLSRCVDPRAELQAAHLRVVGKVSEIFTRDLFTTRDSKSLPML